MASKEPKNNNYINARTCAYNVFHRVRETDGYGHDMFDKYVSHINISKEDKAFARLLLMGAISTVGTLDMCLNKVLRSPGDVNNDVRDALLLSTFEIIFLKKNAYAAVNEGVNLVKRIAPRASGLANACLHKMVSLQDQFPFGDPKKDHQAFANVSGFPYWLTERIFLELGDSDAHEFMPVCNNVPPIYVAVNMFHENHDEVLQILQDSNCGPVLYERLKSSNPIYHLRNASGIADGRVQKLLREHSLIVSDASAQHIASMSVTDLPGSLFLEIGSGRGTKTLLMQNDYRLSTGNVLNMTCVDKYEFKGKLLTDRARQANIPIPRAITYDAAQISEKFKSDELFDGILIDAPCSGLGTLRRHPEIRWRMTNDMIQDFAYLDLKILKEASKVVKPGGFITYSTCTITHEENQDVVLNFLSSEQGKNYRLVQVDGGSSYANRLQTDGPDAHFAVRIQRVQ